MKDSPINWFNKWSDIIKEYKVVTRVTLSEVSGSSIWTIKGLQRDFLEYCPHIKYERIDDQWKFRLSSFTIPLSGDKNKV